MDPWVSLETPPFLTSWVGGLRRKNTGMNGPFQTRVDGLPRVGLQLRQGHGESHPVWGSTQTEDWSTLDLGRVQLATLNPAWRQRGPRVGSHPQTGSVMQCTLACCCDPISESKVISVSCYGTDFHRGVWSFLSTSDSESGGQWHLSLTNERSEPGCRLHRLAASGLPLCLLPIVTGVQAAPGKLL